MHRITFDEISLWGFKSGKCSVCGKYGKRKLKFWQTLNPFNKSAADGQPKGRDQIYAEIKVERDEWMKLPFVHVKCQ